MTPEEQLDALDELIVLLHQLKEHLTQGNDLLLQVKAIVRKLKGEEDGH